MKSIINFRNLWSLMILISLGACQNADNTGAASTSTSEKVVGQSGVKDETSDPNVVQIAVGSKDHTTLVTAVQTAELVDALSNTGPFTVFAPTNAAFDQLPAGTVDNLLKSEQRDQLTTILQYHVYVGVLKAEAFQDGQKLGMVDGGNVTISKKEGNILINGKAKIVASIPASNGIIHVIDQVLLPE